MNSTAKAGANIASAGSADASYYNPAGMALLEDTWHLEGTATYLHLTSIDYADSRSSMLDGSSENEDFLLPTFFVVSPDYNNFRFGLSLTEPYGLQKRWLDQYPKSFAQKFSLKVFELNPTVSYAFSDMISVGAGARLLYSEATVIQSPTPNSLRMDDETTEWGYNLALDVKPNDSLNFAVTYRSLVDLEFEDGDVSYNNALFFLGDVTVPAPAVLAFSAAYTCRNWTLDLTVDQTYWSDYEELAFDFNIDAFDRTVPKDWDDTVAIRLGAEYRLDSKITLMAGVAYDENPVPEENLGFELPDTDAWLFSVGARYAYSEQMEFGIGILYDYKEERSVSQALDPAAGIAGEFTDASAFLVSLGLSYKF
jgi:long-chain fatty acid transport protein